MVVNSSQDGGAKDTWVLRVSDRPLIGVTTSEVRAAAERADPPPEGDPPQREMALGMVYLRGDRARPAACRWCCRRCDTARSSRCWTASTASASPAAPTSTPTAYGERAAPRSSARPSPTSTRSSSRSPGGRRARDADARRSAAARRR